MHEKATFLSIIGIVLKYLGVTVRVKNHLFPNTFGKFEKLDLVVYSWN